MSEDSQTKQVEQPAKNEPTPDDFAKLKWEIGMIMFNYLHMSSDGKAIEANPATHRIAEYVHQLLTAKAAPKGDDVISKEEMYEGKFKIIEKCLPPYGKKELKWEDEIPVHVAFKAMDVFASQFSAPQVKWVQASKRLPDKAGQENKVIVVGDHKSLPFVAWGYKNFADEPTIYVDIGAKSFLAVSSNANFHSTYPIENIKWLDEGSTDKNQTK